MQAPFFPGLADSAGASIHRPSAATSSADGIAWTRPLEAAPWPPRQYHDVAVFDDRLWVLEGYAKANRNDVWHSADGKHWHEVPNTPWAPRHAASVFVHDGALWVVAGNNMESDVWKLTRRSTTYLPRVPKRFALLEKGGRR